ncbi:anthrax toxin lethal factor-related metalloendopeptidase [Bacillus pretiosus]|uniref:ATLF-like domain-containing protein n=1 Tax=Bacillus pretiosus TaxID=2983392 RepID=A0ABT3ENW7_9BACI|nr:hypothetical protein [Bacillus pretiosus]MCW1238504.1 hypothetical protein [Bacillus pretiosus]
MKKLLIKACVPIIAVTTISGISSKHTIYAQEKIKDLNYSNEVGYEKEDKFKEDLKTKGHERWEKALSSDEKKALTQFNEKNINPFLKYIDGRIDKIPEESKYVTADGNYGRDDIKQIQKTVKTLDKMLESKSMKLKEDIHVYKYLTESDVDFGLNDIYKKNSPTEIDPEKRHVIEKGFRYGISTMYLDPYLTKQQSLKNRESILLNLKLPKDTRVGYLDNNGHILLQRDQGIEITGHRIITEQGRQVIEVEAELVNKRKVEVQIKNTEKKMNEYFKQAVAETLKNTKEDSVKLNQNLLSYQFVKVHTKSLNASFAMDRAEVLLQSLVQNIPNDLLLKTLEKMEPKSPINITDSTWQTAAEVLNVDEPDDNFNTLAFYDSGYKQFILNLRTHKHLVNPIKKLEDNEEAPYNDVQTILYEFGRITEELILNKISKSKEFRHVYYQEAHTLTIEKYRQQTPQEFFASTFSFIFSPNTQYRERIEKEAPKTVSYIKNKLKETGLVK